MDLSWHWYQKGHPRASTILLNNNSFWRGWEVKGQKVRSTQSGCGSNIYPSDFMSHEGYKISFSPGYWILSSTVFTFDLFLPFLCSYWPNITLQLFSALPRTFLFMRRGGGSCTGWSLSPTLHHYSAKGNIQLVLACLWRKGRWSGWWAWSRGSPRVQHCLYFPAINTVW